MLYRLIADTTSISLLRKPSQNDLSLSLDEVNGARSRSGNEDMQ